MVLLLKTLDFLLNKTNTSVQPDPGSSKESTKILDHATQLNQGNGEVWLVEWRSMEFNSQG